MTFTETALKGAFVIGIEQRVDPRGFFARSWCRQEVEAHGLNPALVQINMAFNHKRGTLRGMHYQIAPHSEAKLVRCVKGAIYDVAVDLRPDSPTHKRWFGVELTADNHEALYVPEGFAHGYQTLTDNAEMSYQTSEFYFPECARGVRFDDPAFAIDWPLEVQVISDADKNWPKYSL
jgi:dTDP-4-dehydrorhamnose 3,5-epimerase